MRIGIVSEYVRPWPSGISEHVHHEARELRLRGHDVTVLSGPAHRAEHEGVGTVRLSHELRFTSNGARARISLGPSLLRLRRTLEALSFDVLHVHCPLDPALPLLAVLASPCPVVGTFHASFRPGLPWTALYRWCAPITARAVQRLSVRIAVSEEAERSIARYFPGPYRIVPHGVDVTRFSPEVMPHQGLRAPGPTVLYVGRADPRKGLGVLLKAFAVVRRELPAARLLLAGVDTADLARLTPHASLAGVRLLGYVAPEELPALYAASQVVCAPSVQGESQGVVLLEAMASGKPVVCFDIAGYRDVVAHGRDGWLVSGQSSDALGKALVRWLIDPALCHRAGRAGRVKAERFAWPRVLDAIESSFADARDGTSAVDEPEPEIAARVSHH